MPTVEYGPKVEREARRIEDSDGLTERDRDLLLGYKRDLEVEGLSDSRIFKVLIQTRKFAERLDGKSLADATEDDVKDLVAWVGRRDLAESTKRDYREVLKRFYKWLNGGEYPDKAKWISTTLKQNDEKLPEKLLDEDDVERLIDAARQPRNRALISVMWETGARPGEYLDLEVGDVQDRRNGKKVVVEGKTGARRLPLVSSVPHLNVWLSQHPAGGEPDAPLWCRLDDRPGTRIDYDYFRHLLRKIAERAGVEKPMYPYQFRHSRATYLANWLTEAQMCEYFGWVQGSDRPATYVHLSGRDIDLAYDKMHGLAREEENRAKLSPERCPRCGEIVESKAEFCQRCGLPLDERAALELDREEGFADGVASKVDETGLEGSLGEIIEEAVERRVMEEMDRIRERLSQGNGSG